MENLKKILEEFIDWAKENCEDAFYIFDNPDKAIGEFLDQRGR